MVVYRTEPLWYGEPHKTMDESNWSLPIADVRMIGMYLQSDYLKIGRRPKSAMKTSTEIDSIPIPSFLKVLISYINL